MKSSHKLDDQTRLSRLTNALGEASPSSSQDHSENNVAELSIDELTHELETHGIQAKQIYSGVAAIFEKAGLPSPYTTKAEPSWLARAREKKKWFQEKLKQVKESAQESLTLSPEPVPVFFRNQKSAETDATDQASLQQDQALLDIIVSEKSEPSKPKTTGK